MKQVTSRANDGYRAWLIRWLIARSSCSHSNLQFPTYACLNLSTPTACGLLTLESLGSSFPLAAIAANRKKCQQWPRWLEEGYLMKLKECGHGHKDDQPASWLSDDKFVARRCFKRVSCWFIFLSRLPLLIIEPDLGPARMFYARHTWQRGFRLSSLLFQMFQHLSS